MGFIVASFTLAQLLSAPMWGRFSDRVGRRPTLLIALGASAIAYLIFGFAHSLLLLFLSRLVQGAGGGTVGVIQAYVADSTDPKDRARALGRRALERLAQRRVHLAGEGVQALGAIQRDLGVAVADGVENGRVRHWGFGKLMRGRRRRGNGKDDRTGLLS